MSWKHVKNVWKQPMAEHMLGFKINSFGRSSVNEKMYLSWRNTEGKMYDSNKRWKKRVMKNEDARDFKTKPITRVESTKKCQIILNGLRDLNIRYFATTGP